MSKKQKAGIRGECGDCVRLDKDQKCAIKWRSKKHNIYCDERMGGCGSAYYFKPKKG